MSYVLDALDTGMYPPGAPMPVLNPPLLIEHLLPKLYCDALVRELTDLPTVGSGVFKDDGTSEVNTYHRSSTYIQAPAELAKELEKLITLYAVRQLLPLLGKMPIVAEPMQLLRYEAGGKFLVHTDNAYFDAAGKFHYTSPQRVFTAVVLLNDDYEGGELIMTSVKENDKPLMLKPKAGTVIMFPSDIRYPHEVRPVTNGARFSAVTWFLLS